MKEEEGRKLNWIWEKEIIVNRKVVCRDFLCKKERGGLSKKIAIFTNCLSLLWSFLQLPQHCHWVAKYLFLKLRGNFYGFTRWVRCEYFHPMQVFNI